MFVVKGEAKCRYLDQDNLTFKLIVPYMKPHFLIQLDFELDLELKAQTLIKKKHINIENHFTND